MSAPIKFTAKQVKFLENLLTAEQLTVLKATASLPEPKETVQEEKVQCSSDTKKGTQCKKTCKKGETICSSHKARLSAESVEDSDEEKVACSSTTKKGTPCKKFARDGGDKCSAHKEIIPFNSFLTLTELLNIKNY